MNASKIAASVALVALLTPVHAQCSGSKSWSQDECPETSAMSASVAAAPELQDIVATAKAAGSFETLLAAATAADLAGVLQSEGPFTVFAPTDAAFAKIPADTLASLLEPDNKDKLVQILSYHVVAGEIDSGAALEAGQATTLTGDTLKIASTDAGVMIGDAGLVQADVAASNGIIHIIDTVLMPPVKPTIVELAAGAGTFDTLVAAVKAAGLAETLSGKGPFTVFAPTDAAFAKLPAGTVESLLKPENKGQLVKILTYHVASGAVDSKAALGMKSIPTLAEMSLPVSMKDGKPFIGAAGLVKTDLMASNGVVHVIDTVLLPPTK